MSPLMRAVRAGDMGQILKLVPRHLSSFSLEQRRKLQKNIPSIMVEAGARGCTHIVAYLLRHGFGDEGKGGLLAAAAAARAGHLAVVAHIAMHTPIDLASPVTIEGEGDDAPRLPPSPSPSPPPGCVVEFAVHAGAWDIVRGLLQSGVPLTFHASRLVAENADTPTATSLFALALRGPRTDPLEMGWGVVMGGARRLRDALVRWGVQCALRGTLTIQRKETRVMSDRERRRHRRTSPPLTVQDAMPPYAEIAHPTDPRVDWDRRNAWRNVFTFLLEQGLPVPNGVLTWLVEEVRPCTDSRLLQTAIGRSARVDGTVPDGRGPDVDVALYVAVKHRAPPEVVRMLLGAGGDPLRVLKKGDGTPYAPDDTAFFTAVALRQYAIISLLYHHPTVRERLHPRNDPKGEGQEKLEWFTPAPRPRR